MSGANGTAVPREGWGRLDGLLQGPAPDDPTFEAGVQDWLARAGQAGFEFAYQRDGGRFSLLASDRPFEAPPFEEALAALLAEWRPVAEEARLHSSVRSLRWEAGEEHQTLYAFDAEGELRPASRAVPRSVTSDGPATTQRRAWSSALGVLAIVAALALVGWMQWSHQPTPWAEVELDMGPFAPHGEVVVVDGRPGIEASEDLTLSWNAAEDLETKLLIEDIQRGRVRFRAVDEAGRLLGGGVLERDGPAPALPPGTARVLFGL